MEGLLQMLLSGSAEKTHQRQSARDVVIHHIKTEILEHRLKPGEKLPIEDKLAETLDVGRGSVREAIKVLQSIGVVEIIRGSGTFITKGDISKALEPLLFSVTLSELSDAQIKELRTMFEVGIFESLIEKITDEQIDALEQMIEAMRMEIVQSTELNVDSLVQQDFNFHATLASYTGNPLVDGLYRVILCLSVPLMKHDYSGSKDQITALHNHGLICDALRRRDVEKAKMTIQTSMWHKYSLEHDAQN